MIAAEILIAPRSPDAPVVMPAAGRVADGAAFAQMLAQSMTGAAAEGQPTAKSLETAAEADSALPDVTMASLTDTGTETASATLLAGLTLTAPTAAPALNSPTSTSPDPATALPMAGTTPPALDDALLETPEVTGLDGTPPVSNPATSNLTAPETAPAAEPPADGVAPEGTAPAELPVPEAATSETTATDMPTDQSAEAETPPDVTEAEAEATPEPKADATDDNATSDAPTEDGSNPAPAQQAQQTVLPPLAALIQPLIAAQTGVAADDTDAAAHTEITGSTPRQRGMSGRLSTLTDTQTPASTRDSAPSFTDRLAAVTDKAQDNQPAQSDSTQIPLARHDTQNDAALEADALTSTAQPLPLDSRATIPTPATPQRLADSAPLDTTQSGWEAALTDRITARNTDLGQEIEITLNPENLGHIRIKLDLSDKAATVQIVTDTPQAAQLFQQSEARLADALNRAGLSLTSHDATSRDSGGREGGQRQGQGPGNPRAEAALSGLRSTLSAPVQTGRAANLVNIVA